MAKSKLIFTSTLLFGIVLGALVMLALGGRSFSMEAFAQQVASGKIDLSELFDLQWKRLFHWTTFFESLDGFVVSGVRPLLNGNNVVFGTESVPGSFSEIAKQPLWSGLMTFNQRSNFRTAFIVPAESLRNETAYIVAGDMYDNFYGFKIVGKSLYGAVSNKGPSEEKLVLISSDLKNEPYNIEARYLPGQQAQFFWSGTGNISDPAASITDTARLPSPARVPSRSLMNVQIMTNDYTAKSLQISFFEYLQTRDALR